MSFSSRSEKLTFTNADGVELAGRLEVPRKTPGAFALFAHCFTCSKDVAAASRISRALASKGIGVLRFDFTGLGNSDGDFANTNFSSNVQDLIEAARFLGKEYEAPRLLVGHSLGGAAVLAAAGELPRVQAIATIGAPADPEHVSHLFKGKVDEIQNQGEATVLLAGREFKIKKQFVDDLKSQTQGQRIASLRKALLIFHSPIDDLVGIENARAIYQQAHHPKSFISLDQADHLLTSPEDSQYVADVLASWAGRYISLRD